MIRIHALRRQAIQQAARISDWLDQSQSMRRILIVAALLAAVLLSWRPNGMVALAVYA